MCSERVLHYFFNSYKNVLPLLTHSFLYSLILFIPSLYLFNLEFNITFFFLIINVFTHYSINLLIGISLNYNITHLKNNDQYKSILLELDAFFHISSLIILYVTFKDIL